MLSKHLKARGISNPRVLSAFEKVPREEFVPPRLSNLAYEDTPLYIGSGQTISQPYTVAFMTQILDPKEDDIVLEVGTGSGYQAAILSQLCKKVYTIERFEELGEEAEEKLERLGYGNVEVVKGDGSKGFPDKAPYDGIIVTAASPEIPDPLLEQLKIEGRLVAPVGEVLQEMVKVTKTKEGLERESHPGFRFVPLVGKHGFEE